MDNLKEMDKFLETWSLPKTNQETDNLNRPTAWSDIDSVFKNKQKPKQTKNNHHQKNKKVLANKNPEPGGFTRGFYQT